MGLRQRFVLSAIGAGHRASLSGAERRFLFGARHPATVQREKLDRFLRRNAETAYGRLHGYRRIKTVEAFQDQVPAVSYEELRPWIDRAATGEPDVLSADPIRIFEKSSGSTGGNKLIPYNQTLLGEIAAATGPWMASMEDRHPGLRGTQSYWSLSPVARGRSVTAGGIPIGFSDDTEYFGPLARWALSKMMAVPSSVAQIESIPAWRRETARHLLSARELGLISVWSPSFLTLLMRAIEQDLEALLGELDAARATEIRWGLERAGRLVGSALWPRLSLISCWTEAGAADLLPGMAAYFPGIPIEGKGLFATEGVISFPIDPGAPVLAISSHFIELIDLARPGARPLMPHETIEGGRYSPLITTGAGLARYQLRDVVEQAGWFEDCPRFRFAGKLDRVSDLSGEKLNAVEVERAMATAKAETGIAPAFSLLAPSLGPPPRYKLYMELAPDGSAGGEASHAFAAILERELRSNHHYNYCRDLGQLDPIELSPVVEGWSRYESALVRAGMRAGDIKPTHLDARPIWDEVYR